MSKLARTAAYVARQTTGRWISAANNSSGRLKQMEATLDDILVDEEVVVDSRQACKIWKKAQKAARKAEMEKAMPKAGRSRKLDPVSNSAMRQAFKRDIQKTLLHVDTKGELKIDPSSNPLPSW